LTTSRRLRSTARTWFWFIVGGTLLGAIIALGLGIAAPPGYPASVTLLVSPIPKDTGITNGDLQVAQGLTPTFAELATTRPILERVIRQTGVTVDVDDLAAAVSTRVPVGTSLLTVSVLNQDAQQAATLANGIADELRAYAKPTGVDPNRGLQVQLAVVDPATPATDRDGPPLLVRIVLGAAIALFLTITIAFLVENVWPQARDAVAPPAQATLAAAMPAPLTPAAPMPAEVIPAQAIPAQAVPASTRPSKTKARAKAATEPPPNPGVDDGLDGEASTIGVDPLRSRSTSSGAKIASRGIVNDLELERTRRSD